MYARVARWEGGQDQDIRSTTAELAQRAPSGPPPGVPAQGFLLLADPESGRMLSIVLFDTREELEQGDAALRAMDPPGDRDTGSIAWIEHYEVGVDVRR
jgi:hypothetical protein